MSIIDAAVWNLVTNSIRGTYSKAFVADFTPTTKFSANIHGDAVCLYLSVGEEKFGYCTVKSLLYKRLTGTTKTESVIENSGFKPECIQLVIEIMEREWKVDGPQVSAPPPWPVSIQSLLDSAGNSSAMPEIQRNSPSPSLMAAFRAQAEAAAAIQGSSGLDFLKGWLTSRVWGRATVHGTTAQLVTYIDLRQKRCDVLEDLSLCTQFVSSY